jgi:8-oxo-dGTP pyrophosphatase MutT (NUDIX family)
MGRYFLTVNIIMNIQPTREEMKGLKKAFDYCKALLVPITETGEICIQDRRGYKEPDWGYFGGEIEADETPEEAVLREAKEELGVYLDTSSILFHGQQEINYKGKMILAFVFLYPTKKRVFTVLEGAGSVWCHADAVSQYIAHPLSISRPNI